MLTTPELIDRFEGGSTIPVLVWRLATPALAISSAALGGGIGRRHWVINASVPMDYARVDPAVHLAEMAAAVGLRNEGIGLMTGVHVGHRVSEEDHGVRVTATVGLGAPAWAAAQDGHSRWADHPVGTINVVAELPVRLSDAALVNAVVTATEAKVQALAEAGVAATGTASDAIAILCAEAGPAEPYGGPRSTWGARLARAVLRATNAGAKAWRDGQLSWSEHVARD